MARITLLYLSVDGQTRHITEKLAALLNQPKHDVSTYSIADLPNAFSLTQWDAVVLGCPVRYGKHPALFRQFVEAHARQLNAMTSFFFSVNLTARKPHRSTINTNPYAKKYLKQTAWEPDAAEVFAGALCYSQYGLLDRLLIQCIMKMTGGPTKGEQTIEYTDWESVSEFSQKILQLTCHLSNKQPQRLS